MTTDPKAEEGQKYKLVVVGDGMVGKTSLLLSFVHNTFASGYIPTILETYAHTLTVDDVKVGMFLSASDRAELRSS